MQALKAAHENKGSLLQEAESILTQANVQKRDVSPSENIRLDSIKRNIFQQDQTIARCEAEIRMAPGRRPGSNGSDSYDNSDIDLRGYSLTRALRQASNGGRLDGLEAEVNEELQHRSGISPSGFYIPSSLLAERRAMSVTMDSGNYGNSAVATQKNGFIDALRPLLAVGMAGATVLDRLAGNVDVPRQAAASSASWKNEIADLDEASPMIEQMELRPRRCGAYTILSKQLLIQSSFDVENMIRLDLLQACAIALDLAGLAGTGASNQPTGILSTSGIGDIAGGTNGLAPTWAHLVALVAKVEGMNALTGKPAFIINSATAAKLRATPKIAGTDSQMILDGDTLLGHPVFVSNQVPSNLTKGTASGVCSAILFGDFSQVVLGSFGDGIDVVVDGVTRAVQGQCRVIVNSYVDVGIRQAKSFAAMKDALTA